MESVRTRVDLFVHPGSSGSLRRVRTCCTVTRRARGPQLVQPIESSRRDREDSCRKVFGWAVHVVWPCLATVTGLAFGLGGSRPCERLGTSFTFQIGRVAGDFVLHSALPAGRVHNWMERSQKPKTTTWLWSCHSMSCFCTMGFIQDLFHVQSITFIGAHRNAAAAWPAAWPVASWPTLFSRDAGGQAPRGSSFALGAGPGTQPVAWGD